MSTRPPAPPAANSRDAARRRHRDLVARAPVHAVRHAGEDAVEQRHVAAEHAAGEQERRAPATTGRPSSMRAPGVVEAGELRQQEVQRGERGDQEGDEHEQVAARRAGAPALLVGLLVDLGRRVACALPAPRPSLIAAPAPRASGRRADDARERRRDGRRRRRARPRPARGRPRGRRRSARPGRRARRRASRRTSSRPRPRAGPVSASRWAAMTEVAKCSDGMAARGLPPRKPYSEAQRDLQNSSPYSTIMRRSSGRAAVVHQTLARGVPRRRGRHGPVADEPEVERRVDVRGAAREAVAVAQQQEQRRSRAGTRNHSQWRPDERLLPRREARRAWPNARCRRSVGVVPRPERAVDAHRIGDADAPLERRRDRRWASRTSAT